MYGYSKVKKFKDKFNKSAKRFLTKITTEEFIDNRLQFDIGCIDYYKDLHITSSFTIKRDLRTTFVKVLKDIKYKRQDSSWTETTVIAFMHEVMNLYLSHHTSEAFIKGKELIISERYNVPVNRIKTQMALFLNNLAKGYDKFNINYYFTNYDLINWKYRDRKKLQKDIENNKIGACDLRLLKEYGIIL